MCIVCLTIVSAAAAVFSLTASSDKKQASKMKVEEKNEFISTPLPSWASNPLEGLDNNVIASIGTSHVSQRSNGLSIRYFVLQAEHMAKSHISLIIQSNLVKMVNAAFQPLNIESDVFLKSGLTAITSHIISNLPLAQVIRDKLIQDKQSGVIYVRMFVENYIIQNYLKSKVAEYNTIFKQAKINEQTILNANLFLKNLFNEFSITVDLAPPSINQNLL